MLTDDRHHALEIGAILRDRFNSQGLPVKLKQNDLVGVTFQTLGLYGLRKPFLMSKERFIVVSVLSHPQIYSSVSPAIELIASVEGEQLCWNGTGKVKQREFMDQLREFGMALTDDAFMEINIEPCFSDLRPLVEWPGVDG